MDKPHRNLDAWSAAVELVTMIYQETEGFPRDSRFGITDQLRRAALSVSSNIAEGAGRQTREEFINFLHMAQGSVSEVDTQLEVARRPKFLDEAAWTRLDLHLNRIDKMLSGLIRQQRAVSKPVSKS
jgi:four helix bundle protein